MLICFRVYDRSTFDEAAKAFIPVKIQLQKATTLLVGTHFTRFSDTQYPNKKPQRQVTYEEGVSLAREVPGAIYMETDIEDEFGVLRMIRRLIDKAE